jgi:hypothetical protein
MLESTNDSEALSNLNSGINIKPPDFKFAESVSAVTDSSPEPFIIKIFPRKPKPKLSVTAYDGYNARPE